MISANDIAAEIQSFLGDDFTIYVDNNIQSLTNIKTGDTFELRYLDFTKTINGLFTSTSGEVVALPDLFSTSFSFSIDFFVPVDKSIDNDLNALILAKNGKLNDVGNSKYLLTLNLPTSVGQVEPITGQYYQMINISGNIAITNDSMFGNELKITWDGYDLSRSLLTATPSLQLEVTEPQNTDDTLIPQSGYSKAHNGIDMTLHLRKDDDFYKTLLDYIINPDQLINKTIEIKLDYGQEVVNPWECLILSMSPTFVIGGYVIMDVSLQRFKVIT